jgi:signal transduction histidine kinase
MLGILFREWQAPSRGSNQESASSGRFTAPAVAMRHSRILATLALSATCVAVAMIADYLVTILLLRDYQGYTPLITLCIATLVSTPVTFVLVSNVYKLRAARDELAIARDAAVNANLSKTMFFANMSHELRTPLNAIIGFSQLLETDVFAAKRVEYARLIHESGKHLLDLVNDLLDISKMEAGRFQLEDTEISLGDVVEECCEIVRTRLRQAQLQLIRNVPPGLPSVTADRRAIKQIVLNLLTNAAKFTDAGGRVEVFAASLSSGEVAFGVRDSGIGIAAEDLARIFERYGRSRHEVVKLKEGTGLGLPIVKGLAEAHGGRITLESEPGQGTCVTIWLPAERVHPQQSAVVHY